MPRKLRIGYPRAIRTAAEFGAYALSGQESTLTKSSGAVTPALTVEYVDSSGVRQSVNVAANGSTSISGTAPFLVHFDATGSRSTAPNCNDLPGAWRRMGYRINYGESVGGTYATDGRSRDEDTGPPIFGRIYTQAGTHTTRVKVRDASDGEATISLTVVVSAPPSAVNISVAAGAWPTFVSGTHYTLNRGSDYSSFGTLSLNGLHNVRFSATGSGADPIVSQVTLDNRIWNTTPNAARTRGCAFTDIDINGFNWETHGFEYCGVVRGSVNNLVTCGYGYWFDQVPIQGRTEDEANNIRYPRGLFLREVELTGGNGGYSVIGLFKNMHAAGVTFNKSTSIGGSHCFRGTFHETELRHCIFKYTAASSSGGYSKIHGNSCSAVNELPEEWRSDDRVGSYAEDREYGYPARMFVSYQNSYGAAGDVQPDFNIELMPQNDLDLPPEGCEYSTYEDCTWYRAGTEPVFPPLGLSGRYLSARNLKRNQGSGADVSVETSTRTIYRTPVGWDGPYLVETTNTRPVPSAF